MTADTIHFIGIGGTGISAIALLLMERGYTISGTDMNDSRYFRTVTENGAKTALGHHPEMAVQAKLVVRSSAIKDDDPEVIAALKAGIPVLKRADILEFVTSGKQTLAVAGSHGKTTTTAMLITLLNAIGLDPSFILGAEIKALSTNAHKGEGEYFVIEADEYDYMFLGLQPKFSIITNLEHDHPDCFSTVESYLDAFGAFLEKTLPEGKALLCFDDPGVIRLMSRFSTQLDKVVTYGFNVNSDYQITQAEWKDTQAHFLLGYQGEPLGSFELGLPGRHNILNAAAGLALAHQLGLDLSQLTGALSHFEGTERRFDIVYNEDGIVIINDYGHHPTQIRATIQAARDLYPNKKLWAVWEPHTYSRTAALAVDFTRELRLADEVLITRIYAARETDTGLTPQMIADVLPKAQYLPEFNEIIHEIRNGLKGNDVVLVLSAGKGPQLSADLISSLHQSSAEA
ncbi:MAG: UDP-N-acetylmuramate--L-alanine ligase [Anaerolineaceae bacterium]